ncbi:MAG TPA: DMT family transporter [Candidatus Pacearchaeota archaeon]|nr:DMT family transporter [Candidatus Pacearchaeota archaeon]HOU79032.1 DMT family transporter [Candidatus Pacearchaeota archaeon]HQF82744.1 DMT family transporter [Candidatus Pacearchaeota archaeon]HQI57528.1 DMT family transporter [Candidatus Pacearchaeota archaeon]HQJ57501.1 DMT family transporter [Candidatus Pacearchaeota archaeon]
MIYFPIIAAIALAGGTVLERHILKRKEIDIRRYQTLGFLTISLILLPMLYFFWKLDPQALQLKNILILIAVIICSMVANLFTFYSMKGEKISNLEPAKMLEPLFTILLAVLFSLFFQGAYESNPKVLVASLVAGLVLILTHINKEQLRFNKYFTAAIIGSFFFALEIIISNLILELYSPVTFYFLRCFGIFVFSLILFRTKLSGVDKKLKIDLVTVGIIWVLYRVVAYYGYLKIGIVSTTLILMLGAALIYLFAKIFLKEKINKKNIIASIVILACIIYASFA